MNSTQAIMLATALGTLITLGIILLALHLSKLHQILQGVFLYIFVFSSFYFAYWLQAPITAALAYFAEKNPTNSFYECQLLSEETCYRRGDCTLKVVEEIGEEVFVCVSREVAE